MMMNKILAEILKDPELKKIVDTLSDEEIEDNLLVLYKQKQDNDYLKENPGFLIDNDDVYMESYLEKRGNQLVQMYRPSKNQGTRLECLYMPEVSDDKELYPAEERALVFNAMQEIKNSDKGLYLYGSYGSGKTYLCMRFARELAKTKSVICVYYPEFINAIKNNMKKGSSIDDLIDRVKKVDILLIDDLGREQNTTFNRDQILSVIINYRYQYKLKTIITTNRSIDELDEHLAETSDKVDKVASGAITDRIRHMMKIVELSGKDYR